MAPGDLRGRCSRPALADSRIRGCGHVRHVAAGRRITGAPGVSQSEIRWSYLAAPGDVAVLHTAVGSLVEPLSHQIPRVSPTGRQVGFRSPRRPTFSNRKAHCELLD